MVKLTVAVLISLSLALPVFAGFDLFPLNKGTIYEYDPKEIIYICFFPKDKARWDGYKVMTKNWKQLTDFQKSNFLYEGAKELQRNKQVVIDYGKDWWKIVSMINTKIDTMEKQASFQDIPMIDFLFNFFKEEKMIQWDKKPPEEKKLVLGKDCGMGFGHMLAGDIKGAIPYLEKAIQVNPDDAYAYYFLGTAYGSLGEYKGARENLEKAKKLFKKQTNYDEVKNIEEELNKINQKEADKR